MLEKITNKIYNNMKKTVTLLVVILLSITYACKDSKTSADTQTKVQDHSQEVAMYQCPMDCEEGKTYEKEGICPVCEMDLKKVEQ